MNNKLMFEDDMSQFRLVGGKILSALFSPNHLMEVEVRNKVLKLRTPGTVFMLHSLLEGIVGQVAEA